MPGTNADVLAKSRRIGYLAAIALRAVESADLQARLSAFEGVLKERMRHGHAES